LLTVAVVVFAIATYIAVLFAQGYEFSFSERRFVLTGALTLDANEGANVIIDGERVGSTSVLGDTFSRGRLLPGTYVVSLEREGYSTWTKSIIVQEGLVADFPNILLLSLDETRASRSREQIEDALSRAMPTPIPSLVPSRTPSTSASPKISPTPVPGFELSDDALLRDGEQIAQDVRGWHMSLDGGKVLWWTRSEVWVMWLRGTNYQPFRLEGESEAVVRLTTTIDRAAWWPGSNHIALRSGTAYRVIELDQRGGTNIIEL